MTNTAGTARKVYKALGTTNDITECEHCGRVELKGTIVLDALDDDGNVTGEISYFGAVCGARAAGWTTKEIRKAAKDADQAAVAAARIERDRLAVIESARVQALRYTADCMSGPTICAGERRNCVTHGNAA